MEVENTTKPPNQGERTAYHSSFDMHLPVSAMYRDVLLVCLTSPLYTRGLLRTAIAAIVYNDSRLPLVTLVDNVYDRGRYTCHATSPHGI